MGGGLAGRLRPDRGPPVSAPEGPSPEPRWRLHVWGLATDAEPTVDLVASRLEEWMKKSSWTEFDLCRLPPIQAPGWAFAWPGIRMEWNETAGRESLDETWSRRRWDTIRLISSIRSAMLKAPERWDPLLVVSQAGPHEKASGQDRAWVTVVGPQDKEEMGVIAILDDDELGLSPLEAQAWPRAWATDEALQKIIAACGVGLFRPQLEHLRLPGVLQPAAEPSRRARL